MCALVWQLYTPLTWLGTIYRMTEDSLVDMERMFKLLHLQPEVQDKVLRRLRVSGCAHVSRVENLLPPLARLGPSPLMPFSEM